MTERLDSIEKNVILSASIPDYSDYAAKHKENQKQLREILSFYNGLRAQRMVIERQIEELNQKYSEIERNFEGKDPQTISEQLELLVETYKAFREKYFYSIPGLQRKIADLQARNDERFNDQTILNDALRLFKSAQAKEVPPEITSREKVGAWGELRQKTHRFEEPSQEELANVNVALGHVLHQLSLAYENMHSSDLRSDAEIIERDEDIRRAKEACEALQRIFGSESCLEANILNELKKVVRSDQIERLVALINAKESKIQNEQRYKEMIGALQKQHDRELSRLEIGSSPLAVYLRTAERFEREMLDAEPGLKEALNNHLHNKFLNEFLEALRAELAKAIGFDIENLERNIITYRAIQWFIDNDHFNQLINSGHDRFTRNVQNQLDELMETLYSQADREVFRPYDLPFSIHQITTWFELSALQSNKVNKALMGRKQQRRRSLVAALYLLACTQEGDNANTEFLIEFAQLQR